MYINQFTRSIFSTSFSSLHRRFYSEKKSSANYYHILGVNSNASAKEIKAAFYKLSKTYHPDVNPDDMNAATKFNTISNAYDILNDPIKRQEYDNELSSKRPISDPYVFYNQTSGYAQRARAHRASTWQSPYTSNSFNGGFQENENTFGNSRTTSHQEQYDTAFGRYRDFKNEDQINNEDNSEEERQEKPTSTIVSKLILFSLCLSYGLAAFFTSSVFHAMHFQQQTEEFPSRLLTLSKSSRKLSSKF